MLGALGCLGVNVSKPVGTDGSVGLKEVTHTAKVRGAHARVVLKVGQKGNWSWTDVEAPVAYFPLAGFYQERRT